MRTDVLWTGGWDSTYRVLDASLVQRLQVQPHYLLDPERESTKYELAALKAIRDAALERGAAIEPLEMQSTDALSIPDWTVENHAILRARYGIGQQYLWLSAYAREKELDELELCIHRDDRAYSVIDSVQSTQETGTGESGSPESLFDVFTFPLLDCTKSEMAEWARRDGFEDLMALTWFCHRPTRSGVPCGFCNPCRWTRQEGLGTRIPWSGRFRSAVDRALISHVPGFRLKRSLRERLRYWG